MALETLDRCPLCNHQAFSQALLCRDHLVSHEQFPVQRCDHCSFLFTSPRPDTNSLGSYYESPQYVSHGGAATGIINAVYKIARNFTLRWKYNLVAKLKPEFTILDYGCGTGELLHTFQQRQWHIAGVEPSPSARQKAALLTGINIASTLDQHHGQQFDIITLWHVLEHIPDFRQKLAQLKQLLTPNGSLIIAVPNCNSYDARHYQEHWAAYDVPRHLWHFTKQTMEKLLQSEGLTLHSILPMRLDAYYVSLLSEKNKTKTESPAALFRGIKTAFLSNGKAAREQNFSSLIYIARK